MPELDWAERWSVYNVRVTGEYGTFTIAKTVTIVSPEEMTDDEVREEAWTHTGIMLDLQRGGWEIISSPEGEEWTLEIVYPDQKPSLSGTAASS